MTQHKKIIALLTTASFAFASFAVAQDAAAPAADHPRAVTVMEKTDTDKDGQISEAEFTARAKPGQEAKMAKGFKNLDKDQDGIVTMAELNIRFGK